MINFKEESYTSKASFFDGDDITVYDKENDKTNYIFSGKRKKKDYIKQEKVNS